MLMTIEELSKLVHNPILIDLGHFSLSLIELPLKMHQSTPLLSTAGCVTWFRTFFSQFLSQIQGFQSTKKTFVMISWIYLGQLQLHFGPKKGSMIIFWSFMSVGVFIKLLHHFFVSFLCVTPKFVNIFFCTADRHFNLINTPSTFLAKLPTKSKWA